MCSASEDVQYESGTSSAQAKMCSKGKAHHQYKVQKENYDFSSL